MSMDSAYSAISESATKSVANKLLGHYPDLPA